MTTNYVMRVSSNGQVSIPADTRARWQTSQVVVVDLGELIVMRPLPADPIAELRGKHRNRGLDSEGARRDAREEDALDDQG